MKQAHVSEKEEDWLLEQEECQPHPPIQTCHLALLEHS